MAADGQRVLDSLIIGADDSGIFIVGEDDAPSGLCEILDVLHSIYDTISFFAGLHALLHIVDVARIQFLVQRYGGNLLGGRL